MALVYRLKVATACCAAAAVIVGAIVWGSGERSKKPSDLAEAAKVAPRLSDELAAGKFTSMPMLTYETQEKETLFSLQIKPTLDPVAPKPRDILVLLDTSASQAGAALTLAKRITRDLVSGMAPEDRVSLWTVNTPKATRNLTTGFLNFKDAQTALDTLNAEYASGAVDLKNALEQALKSFSGKQSRQQVMLYLGDGESAYSPLTEADRYTLADKMAAAKVSFFAVPLGLQVHPKNIHSFVSTTGGSVVRFVGDEVKDPQTSSLTPFITRLNKAIYTPVLIPSEVKFASEVKDLFPTKLPPLRGDLPVLMVGKFAGKKPEKLNAIIQGTVNGKPLSVTVSEVVPAPANDNYFLASMVEQWKNSPFKDAPALLRADRALALAFEQNRLAVEELLTQGEWALGAGKNDTAKDLFVAVVKIDPSNVEAQAGVKVVEKIKKGDLTRAQLQVLANPKSGVAVERNADGTSRMVRVNLVQAAQDPQADPNAGLQPDDILKQEEGRRAITEQKAVQTARSSMDAARRQLSLGDPRGAKELLLAQREAIARDTDIGERVRVQLVGEMDALLRRIGTDGARIAQQLAEERENVAKARATLAQQDARKEYEERTRDRIRAFTTLMNQARYEDAYREALVLQQESLNKGDPIPIEAQAIYQIGQAASNLREARELIRLREDRFLLTMMQVEKSHVPYPDEPPVHFPPAKVWKELSTQRLKEKPFIILSSSENDPAKKARGDYLRSSLNFALPLDRPLPDTALKDVLDFLQDVATPPEAARDPSKRIFIVVDDAAFKRFKADPAYKVEDEKINLPKLNGASLSTALRLVTSQINGTYQIREDYIEITTAEAAISDKVVGVFRVEDLVLAIPQSISQQGLGQSLAVLGQTFSLGGGFTGAPFGGLGGAGFGGQVGQVGGFGGQIIGGAGGNQVQGQGMVGQAGNLFQGNNVNLGVGGGISGFGGGALGQFGNLGGQFGIQGNDQSPLLVALIQQVVARGEWVDPSAVLGGAGQTQQNLNNAPVDPGDESQPILTQDQLNSLGFYPPTRTLVVRGTSRFYKSNSSRLSRSGMGGPVAAPANNGNNRVAANEPKKNNPPAANAAGNKKEPVAVAQAPKQAPKAEPGKKLDPKVVWEDAVAKGVTDPGLIIACTDFLAQFREFKHAGELLKASLRKGLTPEPWAQEALAIALEAGQGSPEELERARVSSIDLDPKNASAYLRASKALGDMGDQERALAFCRTAAKLQPDMPDAYVSALAFAGDLKKVDTDVTAWASNGLLAREWSLDQNELHIQAKQHLVKQIAKLNKEGRTEEAKKLQAIHDGDKERDLVIELKWTGGTDDADLDLHVTEASGTTCSPMQRHTAGGGVLHGDLMEQKADNHSETYVAAEAFSGTYLVRVHRVWGKTQGNKATLVVTRHKGTPNQAVEIHTLEFADKTNEAKLTINLDSGRRTALAQVPLPSAAMNATLKPENNEKVLAKLRAMTTPTYSGMDGGFGSATAPVTNNAFQPDSFTPTMDIEYQTHLTAPRTMTNTSVGMQMQAQVTRSVKNGSSVSVRPVFQTFDAKDAAVKVTTIPGDE